MRANTLVTSSYFSLQQATCTNFIDIYSMRANAIYSLLKNIEQQYLKYWDEETNRMPINYNFIGSTIMV